MKVHNYYHNGKEISRQEFLRLCAAVKVHGNELSPTIQILARRAIKHEDARQLLGNIDVIVE